MKKCKKCGETKEDNQFWSNPKTRDKLKSSCIECSTKYNQEHYARNRKRLIEETIKRRKKNNVLPHVPST